MKVHAGAAKATALRNRPHRALHPRHIAAADVQEGPNVGKPRHQLRCGSFQMPVAGVHSGLRLVELNPKQYARAGNLKANRGFTVGGPRSRWD